METVIPAALEIHTFIKKQGWKFCVIGGLALQRWGEPRLTVDADLTVLTGFGGEEHYIDTLLKSFRPRRSDARELAIFGRVLLLYASNGVPLDIALGGMPFEEHVIERASSFEIVSGVYLTTCCAEDLIAYKAFANRDKDWADIIGILQRQKSKLDLATLRTELAVLVQIKEEPEIMSKFESYLKKYG